MIKDFFTVPDPDLTQESSVDPMGLLMIWTEYGQSIFNEKLTTIANDLRVFTFNIFHHHIINRLYLDYTEEIQKAKNYYKTWQTEFDVKAGLLIFLEDLVTHVFYNSEYYEDSEIEKIGILGMSKARMLYNSKNNDEIYLVANKRAGLLKNQLNLGMSGRYKGPMMNMEFFDRSFTCMPKAWEHVNKFMDKWTPAMELEASIVKLITKHLIKCPKKEYPHISVKELKSTSLWKAISNRYLQCFGSKRLPKEIRKYWQDRLGLLSGAPKALYDEIAKTDVSEPIDHYQIFYKARKQLAGEQVEISKIDRILNVEPFLSHSEYLLRYLAQPGIKRISEEEGILEKLRAEINSSNMVYAENTNPRLKELQSAMFAQGTMIEWVMGILAYHKKLMTMRGGNAWVDLDEYNNIKHYFAPTLSDSLNTIPKYLKERPWLHTYYLETLRSIYIGLN